MTIPQVEFADILPYAPLHWTSIAHYLVLIMALVMLMASGDKSPIAYLLILAFLALITGADMYIGKFQIARLLVFTLRVFMLGIPIVIAGISPTEESRGLGIMTAACALPIFAVTFFTCILPVKLGDPRIIYWCYY